MTAARRADGSVLWEGAIVTGLVALVCVFAALLSDAGCSTVNGVFSLDDVEARPSALCRATHFPGLPDTLASWLFVAAVYLMPVAIAAVGTIAAAATGDRRFLRLGMGIAVLLTIAVIVASIALSNVGAVGAG